MKIAAPSLDNPLPYCLNFLLVLICAIGEIFCLELYGAWWTVTIIFVVVPFFDWLLEFDDLNPTNNEQIDSLNNIRAFRYITWIWAPIQLGLIFSSSITATEAAAAFDIPTLFGVLLSTGVGSGAVGITIAHELIHKNSPWESFLGKFILSSCCYGHWYAAHLLGHHKLVGLENDPSTAKLGESFWAFLWRNLCTELPLALSLEKRRLENQKSHFFSLQNSVLSIWAGTLVIMSVVFSIFGIVGLVFFLLQSFVAISLLTAVNYIEHYGLSRSSGEAISGHHSWNSKLNFSNFCLYKLQRHGDHHLHGKRRYQALVSFSDGPQHPYGYPIMILTALIPPLWFRMMDPILEKLKAQKKTDTPKEK